MILEMLCDKPVGFSQLVRQVVKAQPILKRVMEKMNAEYLEGITRVDGGFYMFVGAYWTQVDQDLCACMDLLRPILGPLLQVAGERYLSFQEQKNAQAGEVQPREKSTTDAVQFLLNVWAVQRQSEASAEDLSSDSSDSESSMDTMSSTPESEHSTTGINADILAMIHAIETDPDPIPPFDEFPTSSDEADDLNRPVGSPPPRRRGTPRLL
ncbi:hypothetical protein C8R44DRAFT_394142 [Mycena epipterygia]|nr:hypothetical protein C8R44DRAFT_394142 [Mycena epipterygia]